MLKASLISKSPLKEESLKLNELVFVGYGAQKKANLTGAVDAVSGKDLENRSLSNVSEMLQGTMPNVQVTFNSGEPGAGGNINVRGFTSINGGSPLVLVDGVPGDINSVNPKDIESIFVLKDAASAAIYGVRAAFGVILVTTKTAKEGKFTVTYNTFFATTNPTTSTNSLPTDMMPLSWWTMLSPELSVAHIPAIPRRIWQNSMPAGMIRWKTPHAHGL